MKLEDIILTMTLRSIESNKISEEELDKIKDQKELSALLSRKRKQRYNRKNKVYFQEYYQKNKEHIRKRMKERNELIKNTKDMERSIILNLEM